MPDLPGTIDTRAAKLVEALAQQAGLYEKVRRLSERQRQLIEAKDSEALMKLLAEKQQQIAEIGVLAAASAPLRESWERDRDAAPAALRQRVEQAADALRRVLAEIVAIEDQGQAAILGAREAAGEAITRLQKGKAMHKAYGGGKKPPGGKWPEKRA